MFFITLGPEIFQDSFVEVAITGFLNVTVLAMGIMSNYSISIPVGVVIFVLGLAYIRERYFYRYTSRLPRMFHPIPIEDEISNNDEKEKAARLAEMKAMMKARYEELHTKKYGKRRNAISLDDMDSVYAGVRKIKGLKDIDANDAAEESDEEPTKAVTQTRLRRPKIVADDEIKFPERNLDATDEFFIDEKDPRSPWEQEWLDPFAVKPTTSITGYTPRIHEQEQESQKYNSTSLLPVRNKPISTTDVGRAFKIGTLLNEKYLELYENGDLSGSSLIRQPYIRRRRNVRDE